MTQEEFNRFDYLYLKFQNEAQSYVLHKNFVSKNCVVGRVEFDGYDAIVHYTNDWSDDLVSFKTKTLIKI